ncbi:homoserine kinase [Candidatus Poribacteria bacterium]|nr:homoserine kinase [Candidatus Poribacteria bacterium]
MSNKAIARIPASTTNLGSGFDVLGLALQLYSSVELEETDNGICIEIQGIGKESITDDENNLAYRAAKLIFEKVGKQPEGLKLTLTNGIPVERGLGGSGTAILGGLLAANYICGNPFSKDELLNFAFTLEGHPDNVSASLLGGLVVACVENGKVHWVKLTVPDELKVVFVIPDFRLQTKLAREALPKTVSLADAVFNLSRGAFLVASIAVGNLQHLGISMDDRLHQPYRKPLIPGIEDVFSAAIDSGALSVALSGSGPTVAAFCTENSSAISNSMQHAFAKHNIKSETKILDIDYEGAVVSSSCKL